MKPEGSLDTLSSPELEKYLSAGLRLVMQAHKAMKDKEGLLLRNVSPRVMEVFTLTGYVHVIRFEE